MVHNIYLVGITLFVANSMDDMSIIKLDGYACERCEHKWIPRSKIDELSIICPKCKSPYWNTPRQGEKKQVSWKNKKRNR